MLASGGVACGSASSLLVLEPMLQSRGAVGTQDLTFKPHLLQKYSPAVCAPSDGNAKKMNQIANLRTVETIIRIPMITFWQQILIYLPLSSREGICYLLTVPHGGKSFIVTSSWSQEEVRQTVLFSVIKMTSWVHDLQR